MEMDTLAAIRRDPELRGVSVTKCLTGGWPAGAPFSAADRLFSERRFHFVAPSFGEWSFQLRYE